MSSTDYIVKVKFLVEGNSSKGMTGIVKGAKRAANSTKKLRVESAALRMEQRRSKVARKDLDAWTRKSDTVMRGAARSTKKLKMETAAVAREQRRAAKAAKRQKRETAALDREQKRAAKSARELAKSQLRGNGGMGRMIGAVGGIYAATRVVSAGKSAFLDYNSSIEQTTISMAMQNQMLKKTPWKASMKEARGYFDVYQDVAKKSVGETRDFTQMHANIQGEALSAGAGKQDVIDLTTGATILSKVRGEQWEMVGRDIKQILMGTINMKDRTAQLLLKANGLTQKQLKEMAPEKRLKWLVKAMNDPAIKNAANEMETSFAGVTSTFKDNVQIALGKVGLPLMKQMTAEVARWNDWIDKHPAKIKQWGKDFSDGLVKGFGYIKSGVAALVRHKDLIFTIAKTALALKAVQYGIGKGAGVLNYWDSMRKRTKELETFGDKVGRVSRKLGMLAVGVAASIVAIKGIEAWASSRQEKRINRATGRATFLDRVETFRQMQRGDKTKSTRRVEDLYGSKWKSRHVQATNVLRQARDLGLLKGTSNVPGEGIDKRAIAKSQGLYELPVAVWKSEMARFEKNSLAVGEFAGEMAKDYIAISNAQRYLQTHFVENSSANARAMTKYLDVAVANLTSTRSGKRQDTKPANTNITIQKLIVPARDPARFVHDFQRVVERTLSSPTQARSAIPGF